MFRWPWRPATPPPLDIFRRIEALESTCRALSAEVKGLDAEWEIVYRKTKNALTSLNQKARAEEKALQASQDAPGATNGGRPELSPGEKLRMARARYGG